MFNKMKIKMRMKKFLPFAFVLIFFAIVFFSPFGAHKAEASTFWNFLVGKAIGPTIVFFGNMLLWLASVVLWIAGLFFDKALEISITDFHKYAKMGGITTGWTIARDTVNIFFILILLYIAIATILQIAGYGIKELLVKVILIAILVNFSGVATKVIIDASNVLANEFYSNITSNNADISIVFMQGLRLHTVYKSYDEPTTSATGTDGKDVGRPVDTQISFGGVIIGAFGGVLLMLVTSFVLFAGGILFIIRTITLLFLIILSPLAFVGMILPATSSHSKKWWSTLFYQSFFAPAYMFMIYIVVKIISEGKLAENVGMTDASAIMDFAFKGYINTLVYFVILIGLMIGSLIVASKMGAVGTSAVMKWSNTARKWGQGQVGRISKRGAGFVAEKALDEKSWINQKTGGKISGAMRKIPLAASGAAYVSSWREKQLKDKEAKYKKQYGGYSKAAFAAIEESPDNLNLRSETLKKFGLKDVRGAAYQELYKEKERKERRKEIKEANVKKEDEEYEEIENRRKSSIWAKKETGELKKELVKIDEAVEKLATRPMEKEKREEFFKVEAELTGLTNISAEAIKANPELQTDQDNINKKRAGLLMKKEAIKQEHQDDINKDKAELRMKKSAINQEIADSERLRQIDENREKRIDTEKIEERVSKVESASGEKGEKKESAPKKT